MHYSHIFILVNTYTTAMKTTTLVLIQFNKKDKGLQEKDIVKTYRKLYGYESHSHYGRYRNRIAGLIDRVNGIRITKGLIMIKNENVDEVLNFLAENKADVKYWKVFPKKEELELLEISQT